jgi:hypothetical protein
MSSKCLNSSFNATLSSSKLSKIVFLAKLRLALAKPHLTNSALAFLSARTTSFCRFASRYVACVCVTCYVSNLIGVLYPVNPVFSFFSHSLSASDFKSFFRGHERQGSVFGHSLRLTIPGLRGFKTTHRIWWRRGESNS